MSTSINAIDVIEILSRDQSPQVYEHLMSVVKSESDSKEGDGVSFIYFSLEIKSGALDWKIFFEKIEHVLGNKEYQHYWYAVEQHILEGLSNSVANGNLPAEILLMNTGPFARDYLKRYEMYMDKKTIF